MDNVTPPPIQHEPFTVYSRGRLYTTERQRRRLGVSRGEGRLRVGIVTTENADGECRIGSYGRFGTFVAPILDYGEITIPAEMKAHLQLREGDTVRVTLLNTREPVLKEVNVDIEVGDVTDSVAAE